MRVATKETTVYTYPELSDSAKQKVRERISTWNWEDGSMVENCQMIADGILEDAGFEEAENLTFQLYSQNNGPHFKTQTKESILLNNGGKRRARYDVYVRSIAAGGGSYYFDVTVLDQKNEVVGGKAWEEADQLIRDLAHTMDKAFYVEDEYNSSDEQVAELCESNGYEFDVNGKQY